MGGTLGAVMVQCPTKVFVMAIRMGSWAFITPKLKGLELIGQMTDWSMLARKDGILALEAPAFTTTDPFLKKGLLLLVDGHSAEKIREVLEVDIRSWEQLRWQSARAWEAAAGYSPTIGIIGAVLGLMQVMQNLSNPEKLGSGNSRGICGDDLWRGLCQLAVSASRKQVESDHHAANTYIRNDNRRTCGNRQRG